MRTPLQVRLLAAVSALIALGVAAGASAATRDEATTPPAAAAWTAEERAMIKSLSLSSLGKVPADPSNRYADNDMAAELGNRLFFETKLSANGKVSCGTCHLPDKGFQDDLPLGIGVGTAGRRTMPIAGMAHSPWQFWDGRSDSQWSQALGPLESPVEHGGDRVQYAHVIANHHGKEYQAVFGALPDLGGLPDRAGPVADPARSQAWNAIAPERQGEITRLYANIGKAIAAFERRITFMPSRFDRFADAELAGRAHTAEDSFTEDERAGLRLFIGKASCSNCHNGPLLTDNHFHNTGVPAPMGAALTDSGRTSGVKQVVASEFNCIGRHSDATPGECSELRFAVTGGAELLRAYKTPSLRNSATRPPYMHAGQIGTLREVLDHYNRAPRAPAGKTELRKLRLSDRELRQLEAFLHTLNSPIASPPRKVAR